MDSAIALVNQLNVVATFRNKAPDTSKFEVLCLPSRTSAHTTAKINQAQKLANSQSGQISDVTKAGLIAAAEAAIAESKDSMLRLNSLITELDNLTPEQRPWTEWFFNLPENHKRIVEVCAENGIKAGPHNFDSILKALSDGDHST